MCILYIKKYVILYTGILQSVGIGEKSFIFNCYLSSVFKHPKYFFINSTVCDCSTLEQIQNSTFFALSYNA